MRIINKTDVSGGHHQAKENVSGPTDAAWMSLYRIGGAAALTIVALFFIEIVGLIVWRPPTTVTGYFSLFQNNRLLGLFDFYVLDIVAYVFFVPVFLALYFALRRVNRSLMTIGTAIAFFGIAAYLVSNTAFCMLSLSDQYAAATTDAQRSLLLAAGQVMLTVFNVNGLYVSYALFSVSGLIISSVMVRSIIFSRATGYAGIMANIVALGAIALVFNSMISGILIVSSFVFLEIWLILIARNLLKLNEDVPKEEAVSRLTNV
jgi:hypothetical protein